MRGGPRSDLIAGAVEGGVTNDELLVVTFFSVEVKAT